MYTATKTGCPCALPGQLKACLFFVLVLAANASRGEISVQDFQQRTVTLEVPAQRIVALAPHIVENTFSAGAGGKLVGVVSYSNYPEQARQLEQIGSHNSWSLEAIAALRPDLILMWASGNGMNSLSSLNKLGVPVYVSEPRRLEDIPETIRAIGKLAGTEQISEPEAQRLEHELANLAGQYKQLPKLDIFYQMWNEPLQTLNGEHMISHVIELCGGRNAFADALSLAPKISLESVLHRDPEVIVASGMGEARPDWLDMWYQYPSLTAVKNKNLFFVHPDHIQRPTSRILLGAKSLCEQLHSARVK
jgi:iron complex transport system substrate-binding protein